MSVRAGRVLSLFGHGGGRFLVRPHPSGLRRAVHHHVRPGFRAHPLDHDGRAFPRKDQGRCQRARLRRELHSGVRRDQDVPEFARLTRLGAHLLDVLRHLRARHSVRLLRRARDQGQVTRRNPAGTRQVKLMQNQGVPEIGG